MSRKTQGTNLWIKAPSETDPDEFDLIDVGCIQNLDVGTDSQTSIDITCLSAEEVKEYDEENGLIDPGTTTFDLNADPKIAAHKRLFDLKNSKTRITFIVGWAGKKKGAVAGIVPTMTSAGVLTLPTGRSWNQFDGTVKDFPFKWDADSVVKTTVTVKRKTVVDWIPEA